MAFITCALLAYIPLLSFTGLLGLAVMPASITARDGREVCTLIAPAMGSAVWCAATVPLGLLFRFDGVLLWPALLAAIGFIALRRRHLRPLIDRPCALFALGAVLTSVFVMYHIAPHTIDGGLYFGKATVLDHCKAAMVDSIAANGLPPLNPWLADDGVPVPVSYYFGWHAMASQLCVMAGMSGYLADVTFAGFNVVLVLLGMGGIVLHLGGRKSALALLLIFAVLNSSLDPLLPESWLKSLFPSGSVGFWDILNGLTWTCQHSYSGIVVMLTIFLYLHLLRSASAREALPLAALVGVLAAAAFLTSVYAGIFALLIFAVTAVPVACARRDIGPDFRRNFVWQMLAAAVSVLLVAQFLLYLFSFYPEEPPLAFGVPPFYTAGCPLDTAGQFINFFGFVLPLRMGIAYVIGVVAMLVPNAVTRDKRLAFYYRLFTLATFLSIFAVHSTFYSNDYGWRSVSASQMLLACFAAVFVDGLASKRWSRALVILVLAAAEMTTFPAIFGGIELTKHAPAEHRAFAAAVPGWEVVREHTTIRDMVLCNPAAFRTIGTPYDNMPDVFSNPFFALYAGRYSPMGELLLAKIYSEFYSQEKLNARYERTMAFFGGEPPRDEVDFVRDELKVKAILVTPQDGLWNRPGALAERYNTAADTDAYRVYVARE